MKTLREISSTLRSTLKARRQTQAQLREAAGITQRTLTNVLSGEQDFKVTTLLAVADRLGLELLLVPKAAVRGLAASQESAPVMTLVQQGQAAIRLQPPAGNVVNVSEHGEKLKKTKVTSVEKNWDKGGSHGS